MKPLILGCDVGRYGALCFLDRERREIVDLFDFPLFKIRRSHAGPREVVNEVELARLVGLRAAETEHAFIELVGPRPKEGAVGRFSFGFVFGAVRGICATRQIPMTFPHPAKWKREMGCPANKGITRQRASHLMPREAHRWAEEGQDDRAEAALIALYGISLLNKDSMARAG